MIIFKLIIRLLYNCNKLLSHLDQQIKLKSGHSLVTWVCCVEQVDFRERLLRLFGGLGWSLGDIIIIILD